MEGLKKRVLILGVVFLACGLAFQSIASTPILHDGKQPDEKWLEGVSPRKVSDFAFRVGEIGPDVTYRMNEDTYKELRPYGIVARVFDNGYERYDTVVIMSNKKYSFHDPSICFTAQGWLLENLQTVPVKTKKHGEIPVTMASMIRENTRSIAVFFYRGPNGFVATPQAIKSQMFWHQFFNFRDAEGVFYRIIPLHSIPEDAAQRKEVINKLERFVDDFLTAADESSKGLL